MDKWMDMDAIGRDGGGYFVRIENICENGKDSNFFSIWFLFNANWFRVVFDVCYLIFFFNLSLESIRVLKVNSNFCFFFSVGF